MMRAKSTSIFLMALICMWVLVQIGVGQVYDVKDVGALSSDPNDSYSQGLGINRAGWVVGGSDLSYNLTAFLWDGTTMRALSAPPQSLAEGIDDTGRVVGDAGTPPLTLHATLWLPNGVEQDLGTLPGGVSSGAMDINNSGQVTGNSDDGTASYPNTVYHAFIWTATGGMEDLGTFGGTYSIGLAINELGQIVGYSIRSVEGYHAFSWTRTLGMVDLGTLRGGTYSAAEGINDLGEIVGWSDSAEGSAANGIMYAVMWKKRGHIRYLGMLRGDSYSFATATNNAGQIVGESGRDSGAQSRAVIWNGQGRIRDLNQQLCGNSGWLLRSARGINSSGQITGYGTINGQTHAFLLTPQRKCSR